MRKVAIVSVLLTLCLTLFGAENGMAYDQYYLLKQAHAARNSGNIQEAIRNYQDYINSHPFSQNFNSSKAALRGAPVTLTNRNQYLLRNLLIAYKDLLRVLGENGRTEEVSTWLTNLKSIYDPEGFGLKNSYNLAIIFQENNRLADCTAVLEKIITRHLEEYKPGNNKVFLRAASMLMTIYAQHSQGNQILVLCNNLLQCPRSEFDNNDSYKLATLLLKEAQTREIGERLLTEISNQAVSGAATGAALTLKAKTVGAAIDTASILKAKIRLMKCKFEENDKEGLDTIASQCRVISKNNLPPSVLYKLGVAFLKYNKKSEGKEILERISRKHPDSIWSRKSLFLLGRNALSEEDWTAAINYYSTYIQRYPEQTFFCLKAYSNILDAYWSRDGDLAKQQLQIDHFADIINQTADYETQLNMARELSYKGFGKLADSTFILGYTFALDTILNDKNTLAAMRANWQLTKYGFEVGRFDIASDSGKAVLDTHEQIYNSLTTAKEKERADHYLSRTLLWLAKLYATTREEEKAKQVLQRFVRDFPNDADSGYATYQLGRLYEQEGLLQDAAELYRQIKKKQWRTKADKALQRIGAL
ncbi:MAG TPA: tetratricopeptide repeat protein [Gammaproteobacteria bacterium]|nr:tetratricopeptide repeat protein [Gammaproteobacteria bacterium]